MADFENAKTQELWEKVQAMEPLGSPKGRKLMKRARDLLVTAGSDPTLHPYFTSRAASAMREAYNLEVSYRRKKVS